MQFVGTGIVLDVAGVSGLDAAVLRRRGFMVITPLLTAECLNVVHHFFYSPCGKSRVRGKRPETVAQRALQPMEIDLCAFFISKIHNNNTKTMDNNFAFQVIENDGDLAPGTVRVRIMTMRTFDPFREWLGPYLAEGGGDWLDCFTKMIPASTQCTVIAEHVDAVRKILTENGYAESASPSE